MYFTAFFQNSMSDMEESLTLSRDIKRACELLEKLQKSKYCGEVSEYSWEKGKYRYKYVTERTR